jgi:carbamoyltransferase
MWHTILPSWLGRKLHLPSLIRKSLGYTGPILQGTHHRSHAASAFFPSPFERAAILTIDGVGEWATASIGRGEGRRVELLKEMRFPNSLGLLYSAFTHFTGFKVNSGEYKMMGLAPYGKPVYAQTILDHLVDLKADGSLELNLEYFAFLRETNMTSSAFERLFDGPRRKPEDPITRREIDLARSIQTVVEEAMLRMSRTAHTLTGESKLCLAGGVALNCVANGRVLREGPFEDLWIQPAAGDSGGSLGVALDVWHTYFGKARTPPVAGQPAQGGSYLGPSFSGDEIQSYLETFGYPYWKLTGKARNRFLSRCLREGKVVGHFAGRLEFGPRALGARSILGDPRNEQMQSALNLRIKYRESFRPFAPAVLAEHASEFFDLDRESPYMLIVAPVREERRLPFDFSLDGDANLLPVVRQVRSDVPAVTHVDYSARIQTVRRDHHPEFYDLIRQFHRDTGYPLVVNTSFNVRGEPIVCTPQDAYRCFMRTDMDVLALGDCILLKPGQPAWPEGKGEGLENEDANNDVTGSLPDAHPPQLQTALDQIFERQFWPAAEQLRAAGQVLINGARPASAWVDANEPADLKPSFTIAPSLQSEAPEPRAFARDLVRNWHGPEAARVLEPVVATLVEAGRKHPVKAELEEVIPESVYAMF